MILWFHSLDGTKGNTNRWVIHQGSGLVSKGDRDSLFKVISGRWLMSGPFWPQWHQIKRTTVTPVILMWFLSSNPNTTLSCDQPKWMSDKSVKPQATDNLGLYNFLCTRNKIPSISDSNCKAVNQHWPYVYERYAKTVYPIAGWGNS